MARAFFRAATGMPPPSDGPRGLRWTSGVNQKRFAAGPSYGLLVSTISTPSTSIIINNYYYCIGRGYGYVAVSRFKSREEEGFSFCIGSARFSQSRTNANIIIMINNISIIISIITMLLVVIFYYFVLLLV